MRPYISTLAMAGMGIMLSILVFAYVRASENERARNSLERRARDVSLDLQRSIENKLQVLEAFDSFYAVSGPVDRASFEIFASNTLQYQPDIQAIAWVPRVLAEDRAAFEERVYLQEGYENYRITELSPTGHMIPAADRNEYFPVLYVAPRQGNEMVVGFDLASEFSRRITLYQALGSGEITATIPVRLVQTPERAPGLIAFLPIYQRGAFLETSKQRAENLQGFVTLGLRINAIIAEPLNTPRSEGLVIYMYDAATRSNRLRYQEGELELVSATEQPDEAVLQSQIEAAGRTWAFDFYASPDYFARVEGRQAWEVLILGWGFTLLLLIYLYERHRTERTLRHYTVELQARNRELDAYSHTIAHDLKAPLGIAVGYSGFMLDEYKADLPADVTEMVQKIQESATRMSGMIDNLLHLATLRDEAVRPVNVDMQQAARQATDRFEMPINARKIRVVIEPGMPVALGHAPWLEEVFANLLGNAIKYIGENNTDPRIVIRGWRQGSYARYEVQDNGIGIAPEYQTRIFEMFAQVDKNPRVGHGLGLSIVQRIIARLEGSLGVESTPGTGSTFWFLLPTPPAYGED